MSGDLPAWQTLHEEALRLALLRASTVRTLCVHTFRFTRYWANACIIAHAVFLCMLVDPRHSGMHSFERFCSLLRP